MAINTDDSLKKSDIIMNKHPLQFDDLTRRTKELKQMLIKWRHILCHLNDLLEWEHKFDPLIIFSIITSVFYSIFKIDPPLLTLISFTIILLVLIDLLVPDGLLITFKNVTWTRSQDMKYTRLCERIAKVEKFFKFKYDFIMEMRQERPYMHLIIGSILLIFLAYCCQKFNNLFLSYLAILAVCLTPGMRHRQLVELIHQHMMNLFNKNQLVASYAN